MKLSLCIATFNEEQNIHYPLDSAYDFVDEVVIVDGGSTDKTVEKAKSYGKKVKVLIEPNPAMFHINKQKAIEAARGEWILQLDADEEISNELKNEIVKLLNGYIAESSKKNSNTTIQQYNNSPVAYWVPRKNWFLTRFLTKGGQYPDYTIRLYKNGAVRFPLKNVHENVEIITNKTMKQFNNEVIGFLKSPILHYADPTFSRYLKRWDRYTSSEADLLISEKKQPGLLDYYLIKPVFWFILAYFRHRGYVDGYPGFLFALFSAIRFWSVYAKWWSRARK